MVFFENKKLLSAVRRAVQKYGMISEGDRVAVGVSGGKDSTALLTLLYVMRGFYPEKYDLSAICVDAGFTDGSENELSELCSELGIGLKIVKTDIAKIVFEAKRESNPCSLCSRMRRAALTSACEEIGANKLALGHHFDDVVGTFLLNLTFEGRLGVFSPVTSYDDRKIAVIRPLIYAKEKEIVSYINKNPSLIIKKSPCPEDKATEREEIKKLIAEQEKLHRGYKHRIFRAIEKAGLDGFKE